MMPQKILLSVISALFIWIALIIGAGVAISLVFRTPTRMIRLFGLAGIACWVTGAIIRSL